MRMRSNSGYDIPPQPLLVFDNPIHHPQVLGRPLGHRAG